MKALGFWKGLQEIDKFFQGKDPVHQTLRRVINRLKRAKISHAVVGGLAVFAYHYRRTTEDVDILLTKAGLTEFRTRFVPRFYSQVSGRPRRFLDRTSGVALDILVTGLFPGSGQPGPIAYPDPASVCQAIDNIQVVDLPTLVQLKLAAGRFQDFADVVALIRCNGLDESFLAVLHPTLQGDYVECLEEKRREDQYEAREE